MVFITGDIHGETEPIYNLCESFQPESDDIVVILGDAGLNYTGRLRDRIIKEELSGLKPTFFCIHGNHENRPQNIASYKEKEYDILPQAEIMGFLVAETEMTQRYIYELAANVMYEASFFGFEEEDKQEVVEELKKRTEEIKSGTTEYHTWEEFKKECDFDEESPDETELHNKVVRASYDYSKHSAMKELNKIREMLNAEIENEENTDIV